MCRVIYSEIKLSSYTVQLKNFIQRAKFDPEIDDNYFARSQENTNDNSDDIISTETAKYVVISYCIGFLLSIAITVMILIIYLNTNRWDKKLRNLSKVSNANKYSQAKIFSVAITTITMNLYIVGLDGFALYAWIKQESDVREPEVLTYIPIIVSIIDVLAVVFWMTFCILGLCSQKGVCCKERLYTFLATSTLGPTLSLVVHLPYILIAYLNDATYASSIFIYYTIIVFILFGALDLIYSTCMGALKYREDNPLVPAAGQPADPGPVEPQGDIEAAEQQLADQEVADEQANRELIPQENEQRANGCNPYPMFICGKTGIIVTFVIAIPVFTLLIVVLMGMITATLVVIPISKALSDAPNRLFGFYQVVIVLVGAYFVYRKLFSKKPSLESVVEETEKNIFDDNGKSWEGLSNDEKLKDFYSHIMKIAGKIDPKNNNIKKRERQPTQQQLLELGNSQRQLQQVQQELLQQLGQQHQEMLRAQQQLLNAQRQLLEAQRQQANDSDHKPRRATF